MDGIKRPRNPDFDPVYPCDGCGEKLTADVEKATLWLAAPLGLTAVHVHKIRECAERAREARGGGRFIQPPAPTKGPLLRQEGDPT